MEEGYLMAGERIYLDNGTATKPFPSLLDKKTPFYRSKWGSTNSIHQMGYELFDAIDASLHAIDAFFDLKESDCVYPFSHPDEMATSLFLSHYLEMARERGKNHFLSLVTEEARVIKSLERLEQLGCAFQLCQIKPSGEIDLDALQKSIRPRSALLSLSYANPLTGVIQPIQEISRICKEKGIYLHVDLSAMIGRAYINFKEIKADYLTLDGEKFHTSKESSLLIVKEHAPYTPFIEKPTSLTVSSLVDLAHSLEQNRAHFDSVCTEVARLRDRLEEGVQKKIPESRILFKKSHRLPHVSCIGFPTIVAEALLFFLNESGIFATLGGNNFQKLSAMLLSSGVDPLLANGALSFSLSYETTEEEIDRTVELLFRGFQLLRNHTIGIIP